MIMNDLKSKSTAIPSHIAAILCLVLCLALGPAQSATSAQTQVQHIVIVGVDGMSPDGVLHADAPNMSRMRSQGAWTFKARGVMPTSSSPNWASMIMGAGPEQHGVTSNDWETNKFDIAPTVTGPGGIFPTIFGVLRQQQPSAGLAVFHDWDGFGRLLERRMVDVVEHTDGPTNAMRRAVTWFETKRPALTFIQLDHVDHALHESGHGTPEYYAAVAVADQLIGEMIAGIEEAGLRQSTLLWVTSDHGGRGKKHGGATMQELEIPWIMAGPGVIPGHEIKAAVNTYDMAPTIAWIFGAQPPECWIGRPIREPFRLENR